MKSKLLILLFLASLNTYAQTNLVPNGNFETWTSSSQPDNWFRYFSGFASQSNSAQNGTSSTNMMIADGTFNYINSQFFPVVANKTYRVTLYHKLVSGSFSAIDLSLYHKPGTFKEEIIKKTDATVSNSQWRKIEFDYTPTVSENIEVDIWTTGTLNSEILVDNVSVIDVATIGAQYTLIPDVNFEKKLIALGIDSGVADGKVLTNSVNKLTSLDVSSSSIADLTGIQDFVALKYLNCGRNQLTNLNVSKNTALTDLYCFYNQITSIDVSQNIDLKWFMCHFNELTTINVSKNPKLELFDCLNNKITSLDISKNPLITELACENNQLAYLNLKNGANTILDLTYSNFVNNPNLKCIQVDDLDYSNANWSDKKDTTASYNIDCTSYTLIPDTNFEDKLIALEIDKDGKNGKVITASINQVTFLDVADSNISDLTGLQDFAALIYFFCDRNNITTIDFSKNLMLENIGVLDNDLTSIDVSKNTKIHTLELSNNQIASVDLSKNTNLKRLGFNYNNLTEIDLTNISLTELHCRNNKLTNIDLKNQSNLVLLDCASNKVASLDLSTNKKLEELYCEFMGLTSLNLSENKELVILNAFENQLTTLDISQNPKLKTIFIEFNPLKTLNLQNGNNQNFVNLKNTSKKSQLDVYTSFLNNPSLSCIKVDDEAYSNANWSKIKDGTATYSTTCSSLGIEESVFDKVTIYPIPTKGELHIDNIVIEKATVYDALGKLVKTTTFTTGSIDNTIYLTGLPKGIYFVYLESEGANTAKKVIVE
jgi:Leucine-rich repeat (LRR) protein